MIKKIYSIYDNAVGAYLPPFYMTANGEAIRGFTDVCNDETTQFNKNPQDFTLFELGEFDDLSCTFNLLDTPNSLGKANEFKIAA